MAYSRKKERGKMEREQGAVTDTTTTIAHEIWQRRHFTDSSSSSGRANANDRRRKEEKSKEKEKVLKSVSTPGRSRNTDTASQTRPL